MMSSVSEMKTCLEAATLPTIFSPPSHLMCSLNPAFRPGRGTAHYGALLLLFSAACLIAAPPRIDLFSASERSVPPGTSVTLNWIVNGADTLSLDGLEITGQQSITVSPLVTTTYSLTASSDDGTSNAMVEVVVLNAPRVIGAEGRFIEVVKNDLENTRLHLSEIEVFRIGVVPDEADPDGTSSNDLVQALAATAVHPPTTALLDHGDSAGVLDGDLEAGNRVWSTRINPGTLSRYMLDLGSTEPIGFVRLFGRDDACCLDRLEDLTINLYADDGGSPGVLVNSANFPGTGPAGATGALELDLSLPDPGIRGFTVDNGFIPPGAPVTLSWTVNSSITSVSIDQGVGEVTARTVDGKGSITLDPGPGATAVYTLTAEWPDGRSEASLAVEVSELPLIYHFNSDEGLVPPGTTVSLDWEVVNATSLTLNGVDVTGTEGTELIPTQTATYTLTATNSQGSESRNIRIAVVPPGEPLITEFMAVNTSTQLDEEAEYSDWIEICNPTAAPAHLRGYYLTDDAGDLTKWRLPNVILAPGTCLIVFASGKDRAGPENELHTNFSLDRDGEYLALVKPDGHTIVNEFSSYPAQREDISYGFDAQSLQEGYFTESTPGAGNAAGFTGFVADTTFSVDRGFFDSPIEVEITSDTPDAIIRYTTDGSEPTSQTGLVYSQPVPISRTTVLRAAAFRSGLVPTNVDTQTYIFPADVVALPTMNPNITQNPVYGPRMHEALRAVPSISLVFPGDVDRREKQASVELINFEFGSTQLEAGMERFGNYVTNFSKRGIRLNFRSQYGPAKLRFPVFDGHEYSKIPPAGQFDSIDFRSGNHDMQARGAYMSNRFTDDTMLDMGNVNPHGRFVHMYLNGQYWGQYHMRERWNGAMLAEYLGGRKEDYEAINANNTGNNFLPGIPYDGTGRHWNQAQSLVNRPNTFQATSRYIDIPNVIDFMILWSSGQSESEFRSAGSVPLRVPFKFFLKDADGWLRGSNNPIIHQGPINIMARLRAEGNPDYEMLLADRIHKHFFNDGALTPAACLNRLQARVDEIEDSFLAESARWNMQSPTSWKSYQTNAMRNTLRRLSRDMVTKYRAQGMYPDIVAPSFSVHGGEVPAGFELDISAPLGQIYYTIDGRDPREAGGALSTAALLYDDPITLTEIGTVKSRVLMNGAWSALNEALFIPEQNFGNLVVSEFMYNPGPPSTAEIAAGHDDSEDFEYLELLNAGIPSINLAGLRFTKGIQFEFSSGDVTELAGGQRLLVVKDRAAFEFRHGAGLPVAGQFSGQLRDEGETLELSDPLGRPLLVFTYDNRAPWPGGAAGRGSSLVLVDPISLPDHNRAANWQAGVEGGTPGLKNEPLLSYQAWAAQLGIGAPGGDPDDDGWSNFLEFNLLGDPFRAQDVEQAVRVEVTTIDLGAGPRDYLTLSVRHRVTSNEISIVPELSHDLLNWNVAAGAVLHTRSFHGDGSATSVYRDPNPLSAATGGYLRVRFVQP